MMLSLGRNKAGATVGYVRAKLTISLMVSSALKGSLDPRTLVCRSHDGAVIPIRYCWVTLTREEEEDDDDDDGLC